MKCWNARDPFDADKLFKRIGTEKYDWEDLQMLVRKGQCPTREKVVRKVLEKYTFLRDLEENHLEIVKDSKAHGKRELVETLISEMNEEININKD